MQRDFEIETVLNKPLMAHLATVEKGAPRDSPVWFLFDLGHLWIFGTKKDSFIKRLKIEPACALSVVDFDLEKGCLRHVGIRGEVRLHDVDEKRLYAFVSKYLGNDKDEWNKWFVENIVNPLNVMVEVVPKSIVAKDVSYFKDR